VGDVGGLRTNTDASIAAQRLSELTQGQEAALGGFSWGRLGAGEPGRVTQSLLE